MSKSIILNFAVLFFACGSNQSNLILGTWKTGQWGFYHTATFTDSTVWFDNHVDTLFHYDYEISNDSLFLNDGKIRVNFYFSSNDSLIINGLPYINKPLHYAKK